MCGTTASLCGIEGALEANDPEALESAVRLDIMLHAFLLTQSGIPILYSGDEIGQLNDNTYHDDPLKMEDSRYLHRGSFSWKDAALSSDPDTVQGQIYQALRKLEKLRADLPVFDAEADVWTLEPYNDHILAIGRYYERQKLIALFNFADDEQIAWINEEDPCRDLWTNERRAAKGVKLPGHGFCWLLTSYEELRR
jgi:amylosucrase